MEILTMLWRHWGNGDTSYLSLRDFKDSCSKYLYFPNDEIQSSPSKNNFLGACRITLVISSLGVIRHCNYGLWGSTPNARKTNYRERQSEKWFRSAWQRGWSFRTRGTAPWSRRRPLARRLPSVTSAPCRTSCSPAPTPARSSGRSSRR